MHEIIISRLFRSNPESKKEKNMKPTTDNIPLLLCFSLCLCFLPLQNAIGQQNLVTQACEKTKYKDLCISSLWAENATKDAGNLDTIALIAIKVASNNGSDTSVYIKKILDTIHLEPAAGQTFDDCAENYISAMQQLDDSLSALVSKDYRDAKVWLEAAVTDSTTCETELKDAPGNELELVNRNSIFLKLCTNAMDIMNFLATTMPAKKDNPTTGKTAAPAGANAPTRS